MFHKVFGKKAPPSQEWKNRQLIQACYEAGRDNLAGRGDAAGRDDVRRWIEEGADKDTRQDGDTPLIILTRGGNLLAVEYLLSIGANAQARNAMDFSALSFVAMTGDKTMARCLLAGGAEINASGPRGWTALHFAALYANEDMVAFLLENGADATLRTAGGEDALDVTTSPYNREKVAALIAQKAEKAPRGPLQDGSAREIKALRPIRLKKLPQPG